MQRVGHNRVGRGKLPAFTILELTVVMFLTVIVMASAYMAWTIVAQQFLGYQNTSNRIGELARIELALQRDMEKAERVTRSGDAITFYHPAATNIAYEFESERIVRIAGNHADTIAVNISGIETRNLALPNNGGILVQQLDVRFNQYGNEQKMRFNKEYGVALLMLAEQTQNE